MWFFPWRKPKPPVLDNVTVDFTRPTTGHWASFEGGDNFDARFSICGRVAKGDEILVRLCSGSIGRFCLFSVLPNFKGGEATTLARGILVARLRPIKRVVPKLCLPAPKIAGLLGDGTGGLRSHPSELVDLSSGFTEPASSFWKVLARNEARSARASQLRAAGYL